MYSYAFAPCSDAFMSSACGGVTVSQLHSFASASMHRVKRDRMWPIIQAQFNDVDHKPEVTDYSEVTSDRPTTECSLHLSVLFSKFKGYNPDAKSEKHCCHFSLSSFSFFVYE